MKIENPKFLITFALVATTSLAGFQHFSQDAAESKSDIKTEIKSFTKKQEEIPVFARKSIDWLVSVQTDNGGWGAGSHANQHIKDATKVQTDPGTTAFASLALLRAGNTLKEGKHSENLKKALNYLVEIVAESSEEGDKITSITGTQPQVKLGQNIDATLCVQFFIRILPHAKHDKQLENRISQALDKCLRKIQKSQEADGSIKGGSWAPVLQSAMANNALELAYNQGRDVDKKSLEKSRNYQKQNISTSGDVLSERGAGVTLYSVAGNQRATAQEARKAKSYIDKAIKEGKIKENAPVTKDMLMKLDGITEDEAQNLSQAYQLNEVAVSKMQDDQVIAGFGNNGGEEFLSFMLTSESLVITGGEAWTNWKNKMNQMLQTIQNQDGSWSGHHCITSPVFCTAASILALTAENDLELLTKEKK